MDDYLRDRLTVFGLMALVLLIFLTVIASIDVYPSHPCKLAFGGDYNEITYKDDVYLCGNGKEIKKLDLNNFNDVEVKEDLNKDGKVDIQDISIVAGKVTE